MNNILLVDKPYAYSSFQTVSLVKNLLGIKKLGHGGTLDPLAVGMLPICLGESRKFASYLLDSDKHYTVTANLGQVTTTGDQEGKTLKLTDSSNLSTDMITAKMALLLGEIEQIPPMYSAIKHLGKPLYEYARQGVAVKRKIRKVFIHKFRVIEWQPPFIKCEVHCSKGTYIRTLLDMLGDLCGVEGAALTGLRRDWVAPFENATMLTLEEIAAHNDLSTIIDKNGFYSLDRLFSGYNRLDLSDKDATCLAFGQQVFVKENVNFEEYISLYVNGGFLGIGQVNKDKSISVKKLRQSLVQVLCSVN